MDTGVGQDGPHGGVGVAHGGGHRPPGLRGEEVGSQRVALRQGTLQGVPAVARRGGQGGAGLEECPAEAGVAEAGCQLAAAGRGEGSGWR